MKGFFGDIEKITDGNDDYRRILYTAKNCQLVAMKLKPLEDIGEEIHKVDQFFRFEQGKGKVIIDGNTHVVEDGDGVIIPAGCRHNVINTSDTEPLRLYSLYSPPQHKDGTVHKTKADETEEHFDGKTTE